MIASPRRRLAAIAAVGVVALGVLAGCRTDAGTAAYVGDTRITNDQVDAIAKLVPNNGTDLSGPRTEVLRELVYTTGLQKYAAKKGITLEPVTDAARDQIAQAYNIKNDATNRPFLDLEATRFMWTNQLLSAAPSTTPSDADLKRLFTELQADFQPGTTFDQAKQALVQVPNLPQGVVVRNELEPAFKSYDISISPRYANQCAKAPCAGIYQPIVQLQTQQGQPPIDVVNLPLGTGTASPPVVDLPAAVQTAPAQG